MSENTSTRWGYVLYDDGQYLIGADRVPVIDTQSSARVVGTAKDKDTAILMVAAPDLYNSMKALLHNIALNDECHIHGEIRELERIIDDIDRKQRNHQKTLKGCRKIHG